tara:strand:+ start:31 stop:2061 length:2031 start_codon:yes stop_codon:yes gene_type:complete
MLETRHTDISFIGKDGFQWFIAQVAPDSVWRTENDFGNDQNFENGFRAKIRILGYHPHENEKEGGISDENLPWAHFLVAPQFGAGNNNTGTSFALQGGEMVIGFFLDGEEAQQPVVIGAFYANYNINDIVSYKEALAKGTTNFGALSADTLINNADATAIAFGEVVKTSGNVSNSSGYATNDKKKLVKTIQKELDNQRREITLSSGECEDDKEKMGKVTKTMKNLFDIISKLEKFSGGYIDPMLGKTVDIDDLIDKASTEISGAMSGVIRGVRYEAFEKINKIIDKRLNFLSPTFLVESIAANELKEGFLCAMENILNGLKSFVGKFLKELLGKLINVPLCAAEQFLGGLISGVMSNIQSAIGPILGGLSGLTGAAMPNISSMLSGALGKLNAGIALFSCTNPKCPPKEDFMINVGATPKNVVKLDSILDKVSKLSTVKNIADDLVDMTFPNVGIGTTIGSPSGGSPLAGLVDGCSTGSKKCFPPRVVIFGGGGLGAAADAVVNEIGEVIGVRMQDTGLGYTEPPFVSIVDDCDIGRGATATAIVEDEKVVNIIITNGGSNYLSGDGISDTEGFEVIGEVVGVDVVSTGAGYKEGDTIVSDSGQILTPIIENGRIIGASGKIDQGLSTIPPLVVESETGVGARVNPIVRFVKREVYSDPIVPDAQIITIISCPRFY